MTAQQAEAAKFIDQVLPILRQRGLFREDYEHDTLRGHLGLPIPVNRHTRARQQTASQTSAETATI